MRSPARSGHDVKYIAKDASKFGADKPLFSRFIPGRKKESNIVAMSAKEADALQNNPPAKRLGLVKVLICYLRLSAELDREASR